MRRRTNPHDCTLAVLVIYVLFCVTFISRSRSDYNHIQHPQRENGLSQNITKSQWKSFNLIMEWQRSHRGNGLGNQLFFYASQLGIARRNGLTPVFPSCNRLPTFLEQFSENIVNDTYYSELVSKAYDYPEFKITGLICCMYFPFTNRIHEFAISDVILRGTFQSWKYFHPDHKDFIKERLSLKRQTLSEARDVIDAELRHRGVERESATLIGIHIRRGDILKTHQRYFGHVSPPASYYHKAQTFMDSRHRNALYFVVTNDQAWAKATLNADNFIFTHKAAPEVDLALLMMMDNLIISVGTFSWWAAYMSNATDIVYFNATPEAGSLYDVTFRAEDFWLPQWIGMS